MDDDGSTEPAMVLIRYANLFGAVVTVLATERVGYRELRWSCGGCLDGGQPHNLRTARDHANGHAAICRALPPTPADADTAAHRMAERTTRP